MYPIPEFRQAANRRAGRGVVVVLVVVLGVVVSIVGFASLIPPRGGGNAEEWRRWATLVGVAWALTLAVITAAVVLWRRAARNPLTRCPDCAKSISAQAPLVIASRRCYHCGKEVLVDPDEPPDPEDEPPGLPTRWEYTEADKRYQLMGVPVLMGGMFGSYIGCGGAGAMAGSLNLPAPFSTILVVLLAAVMPVSTVCVMVVMYRRAKRNPTLTCYWCGAILAGQRAVVAATRRCVKCGRSALAPRYRSMPPPHAGPPFTVPLIDEREALRRAAYWRAFWMALGMFAAFVAVVASPYVLIGVDEMERRLIPRVGPAWAIFVVTSGPILTVAVGLIGLAITTGVTISRTNRRHPLDCPRCGKTFLPAVARATRCCSSCHWPVVADDPPT